MNIFRAILTLIFLLFPATQAWALGPEFFLSAERLNNNQLENLDGNWWFFWDRHLTPEQALKAYQHQGQLEISVPSYWNDHITAQPDNPYHHGSASYLARITISGDLQSSLTLRVPQIAEAYQIIWIPLDAPENWVEVANEGQLTGAFQGAMRNLDHSLPDITNGLLLINVKKELFYWGGLFSSLSIGNSDFMQQQKTLNEIIRTTLIGALIFVFLQNLLLYFYYPRSKAALLLSSLAFIFALRYLFIAGIAETVFTESIYGFRMKLEYITFIIAGPLALHFHVYMISGFIYRWVLEVSWFVALSISALTLFVPTDVMSDYLPWYQAFLGFNIIAILSGLLRSIWRDARYARILSLGTAIIIFAAINDIFAANLQTYNTVLSDYALILFMLAQNLIVGRHVATSIVRSRQLLIDSGKPESPLQKVTLSDTHDYLTGLLNRRAFEDLYLQVWDRMKRQKQPLSLVVFEIVNLENINDTYGHYVGDDALISLTSLLKENKFRKGAFICRDGGKDFKLVLPDTNHKGALAIAKDLEEQIWNMEPSDLLKTKLYVTSNFGVSSCIPGPGNQPEDLLKLADDALFHAKDKKQNRAEHTATGMP